jgi:hypothetical protein
VAYKRETALGFENEKNFMEHIFKLQKICFGLTLIELRKTAFKFVHRNGIRTTFNTEKVMAGYDWATGILSRQPELSIRKAEAISYERAMCLNQIQVDIFFNAYEPLVQQLDQQSNRNPFTMPMKVDCNIVSYPIKL